MTLYFSAPAQALDSEQLAYLQRAVIEMCRGGTTEGSSSKINFIASGEARLIVVKGLAEGGGDDKIEVSKEEWDGIKALANPDGYTRCVESTLNLLISKID
jgi:hypothetical protein